MGCNRPITLTEYMAEKYNSWFQLVVHFSQITLESISVLIQDLSKTSVLKMVKFKIFVML